jgi:hypothetical protein
VVGNAADNMDMFDDIDTEDREYFHAMQEQREAAKKVNKVWKKELFKPMSLELTGRVTKILKDTIKSGKNAGKPFYKVNIESSEGETLFFNAWAFEAIKDLQVGQMATVDYALSSDGKYRHINQSVLVTDIRQDDFDYSVTQTAIETPPPARTEHMSSKKETPDSQGDYIHRTSALYNAVEYHKADGVDIGVIINTAKEFLMFIETGE